MAPGILGVTFCFFVVLVESPISSPFAKTFRKNGIAIRGPGEQLIRRGKEADKNRS